MKIAEHGKAVLAYLADVNPTIKEILQNKKDMKVSDEEFVATTNAVCALDDVSEVYIVMGTIDGFWFRTREANPLYKPSLGLFLKGPEVLEKHVYRAGCNGTFVSGDDALFTCPHTGETAKYDPSTYIDHYSFGATPTNDSSFVIELDRSVNHVSPKIVERCAERGLTVKPGFDEPLLEKLMTEPYTNMVLPDQYYPSDIHPFPFAHAWQIK